MLRSLENKVAWVTGAGTGIGEAGATARCTRHMLLLLQSTMRWSSMGPLA